MSVYSVIEIIGTSSTSWEEAAAEAIKTAGEHLRDLRVAEVVEQDIHLDEGGAITDRTKLQLSLELRTRALKAFSRRSGRRGPAAGPRPG